MLIGGHLHLKLQFLTKFANLLEPASSLYKMLAWLRKLIAVIAVVDSSENPAKC